MVRLSGWELMRVDRAAVSRPSSAGCTRPRYTSAPNTRSSWGARLLHMSSVLCGCNAVSRHWHRLHSAVRCPVLPCVVPCCTTLRPRRYQQRTESLAGTHAAYGGTSKRLMEIEEFEDKQTWYGFGRLSVSDCPTRCPVLTKRTVLAVHARATPCPVLR